MLVTNGLDPYLMREPSRDMGWVEAEGVVTKALLIEATVTMRKTKITTRAKVMDGVKVVAEDAANMIIV